MEVSRFWIHNWREEEWERDALAWSPPFPRPSSGPWASAMGLTYTLP